MVGFVFFDKSPRHVALENARALAAQRAQPRRDRRADGRRGGRDVGRDRASASEPDYLQLHGARAPSGSRKSRANSASPRSRRSASRRPPISPQADAYQAAADALLIDAKPPTGAVCPAATASPSIGALARAFSPAKPVAAVGRPRRRTMSPRRSRTVWRARSMCPRASRARRASRTSAKSGAFIAAARAAFAAVERE